MQFVWSFLLTLHHDYWNLYDKKLYKQYSENSMKTAQEKFDVVQSTKEIISIYQKILGEH